MAGDRIIVTGLLVVDRTKNQERISFEVISCFIQRTIIEKL